MNKKLKLWQKVIIGMVLGILFGVYGKEYAQYLKPFGDVFLNMIKMVVVPLILFSILNGVISVSDASTFGRLGTRAFLMYMVTTAFAVTIGLIFANVFSIKINIILRKKVLI